MGMSPWPVIMMMGTWIFDAVSWVWKSRPLTPGSLMSSKRQHGASGSVYCNNSAVEANNFGSRLTDRNKLLSPSRTEASSSTTRTIGAPTCASICLGELRCVTRTSFPREDAGSSGLPCRPRVPLKLAPVPLGFDDHSKLTDPFLCRRNSIVTLASFTCQPGGRLEAGLPHLAED